MSFKSGQRVQVKDTNSKHYLAEGWILSVVFDTLDDLVKYSILLDVPVDYIADFDCDVKSTAGFFCESQLQAM